MPPSKYPLAALDGRAAMALCQYDWSTKTVPKFPIMLIILVAMVSPKLAKQRVLQRDAYPNMSPPLEIIVR